MHFEKYGFTFRLVELEDAAFIVDLRSNEKLSRFLSKTSHQVTDQENWIKKYKTREGLSQEFYFVTIDEDGRKIGLGRIYNMLHPESSFEIGSWLYMPEASMRAPILGDLAIRDYGFEVLKFRNCHFEVRKENLTVVRYHRNFAPELTGEDDLNYYFKLSYENYLIQRTKLLKFLL
jgi:RimJ/RimL family protein N-acetyltransferase